MKDLRRAKSRIDAAPQLRRALASAMVRDTVKAASAARRVAGVVVACEHPDDVTLFTSTGVGCMILPDLGLNQAIATAATGIRAQAPRRNVAALVGDLPYLTASELDVALGRAELAARACVTDRDGTGTTLLTARGGADLAPQFGPQSYQHHRSSGAASVNLPAWSGLRRDVDFINDITTPVGLGDETAILASTMNQPTLAGATP